MIQSLLVMQMGVPDSPREPAAVTPEGRQAPMQPAWKVPVVTLWLVGVNVALCLAAALIGPTGTWPGLLIPDTSALLLLGAKYGPDIQGGEYWRLVTAMFLHAGIVHLLFNMWALLQLGTLCEVLYGRTRFLILYVCSGVMGSIASYKMSPVLGVGASGAIFGLLGVAIVYSIKYRRELPGDLADRMRRSLMSALIINLVITFSIPLIDKWAHLGGLISGALLALITESQDAPAGRRAREGLPVSLALVTVAGLLCYGVWGLAASLPHSRPIYAAGLAVRRGDPGTAIRLLRNATARDPSDPVARKWLVMVLADQRRWSEATQEFLAFARSALPPDEILALGELLASQLVAARRGPEAEAVYRRMLELEPNNHELLNGLAYLYADLLETRLAEAEQLALKAVQELPGNQSFLSRWRWDSRRGAILDTLAWVYFKEGKLAEAYTAQQQAIARAGNNAELRYHMGRIEQARGRLPAARHEYEMALRLNPGYAPARQALAKLQRSAAPRPFLTIPTGKVKYLLDRSGRLR